MTNPKFRKAYQQEKARLKKLARARQIYLIDEKDFIKCFLPHTAGNGRVDAVCFYKSETDLLNGNLSTLDLHKFVGGKYIRNNHSDIITFLKYRNIRKLVITKDRNKIRRAYEKGPSSCMKFDGANYTDELVEEFNVNFGRKIVHPAQAWGGPETSLAILYNEYSEINARAVLIDSTKNIVKIYAKTESDRVFISYSLKELGYSRDNPIPAVIEVGTIEGKIAVEGGLHKMSVFSLPYIDLSEKRLLYKDGKIVLGSTTASGRRMISIGQNLYCQHDIELCKYCSTIIAAPKTLYGRSVCLACIKEFGLKFYCSNCEKYYTKPTPFIFNRGTFSTRFCEVCASNRASFERFCTVCKHWYPNYMPNCPSCKEEWNGHRYTVIGGRIVNINNLHRKRAA